MAATTTGVAMEFESQCESRSGLYTHDRRRNTRCTKPGLSPQAFRSLLMCFPITCMLWAAIIYGAVKLAQ
jgi:hypothetical protein